MAKAAHHDLNGGVPVTDAIGIALEIAEKASATVLALDPDDQPTSEMWKSRYAMLESRTALMARDGEPALRRLYLPPVSSGSAIHRRPVPLRGIA